MRDGCGLTNPRAVGVTCVFVMNNSTCFPRFVFARVRALFTVSLDGTDNKCSKGRWPEWGVDGVYYKNKKFKNKR